MFIHFWERETEREREREHKQEWTQREGDTETKAGARLEAVSTGPDTGLEPTNHEIMTWAEVGRLTMSHPGTPGFLIIQNETQILAS